MAVHLKVGSTWKVAKNVWHKVGSTWVSPAAVHWKDSGGVWRKVLTGRTYSWSYDTGYDSCKDRSGTTWYHRAQNFGSATYSTKVCIEPDDAATVTYRAPYSATRTVTCRDSTNNAIVDDSNCTGDPGRTSTCTYETKCTTAGVLTYVTSSGINQPALSYVRFWVKNIDYYGYALSKGALLNKTGEISKLSYERGRDNVNGIGISYLGTYWEPSASANIYECSGPYALYDKLWKKYRYYWGGQHAAGYYGVSSYIRYTYCSQTIPSH